MYDVSGNYECRFSCKYVIHLSLKKKEEEENHRKKCDAYVALTYKYADLRSENTELRGSIRELEKKLNASEKDAENVAEYKSKNAELKKKLHEQDVYIRKLEKKVELSEKYKKEIVDLTNKVKKQEIRLNMDSSNSSKPSSTNPPEKKKIQNSRQKTGRKPGGQPGHKGHGRNIPLADNVINEKIILEPDKKTIEEGITFTGREKSRTVSDIEVIVRNRTYISREYIGADGKTHWVPFPENISQNEFSYGPDLKAFLYFLLNRCNVSNENARKFVTELTGGTLKPSAGFVQNLMKEFSLKSQKEADEISIELLSSAYMHADFTNVYLDGKNKQVLVCSNGKSVLYLYRNNKGHKGIAGSPVETYTGILIHDHDVTFYSYGSKHQECIIHELRYLAEIMLYEKGLTWAGKMKEFYRRLLALTDEQIAALTQEEIQKYTDEFLSILHIADKEYEENPPKEYFVKGINLCKKMRKYVESELRFLSTPGLPPENNCAERMGRKVKRKMHAMTTFRSEESAKQTCQGLSVIHTASSKGENIFDKLVEIFDRPSPPPVPDVVDTSDPIPDSSPGEDSNPVPDTGPVEGSDSMSGGQPETQQQIPQLYA